MNIISKPTTKIKDIIGDLSYAAYEINIRDPNANFPPPGFGDIRRRLTLSCVFGSGIESGAVRNKAVMLLGPQRNGKSFMVDAVCGELATCSDPFVAQSNPMVSLFSEVILIPRLDYNSLRLFFYERLQKIHSMPRDYCVQALAHLLQGYAFGVILEVFETVLTAERIVRLNITPLSLVEFLNPLLDMGFEATTVEEYQEYCDFFIENSPLKKERENFVLINKNRDIVYKKLAKANKNEQ